ncbi:MAG TPA: hypothetical protein VEV17_23220 [Bryobacteraceae bacterium]|nr:hypothetical protein [Bryobacteraceae bacterium]
MSVVEQRKWMRRLGWIAFSAFVVEGLLGIPMPPRPLPVRLSHTLLAYLLFSTTVLISVFTSRVWNRGPEIVEERTGKLSLQSLSIVSCATVAVQVVLGAVFRYGVTNVIPHILGAMVVAVLSGVTGFRVKQQFPEHRSLRIAATATIGITLSQAVLGMAVLAVQVINPEDPLPVILLISAHVGTGALTLAANVVLAIQIHRNVRKARANAEESDAASTRSQSLT